MREEYTETFRAIVGRDIAPEAEEFFKLLEQCYPSAPLIVFKEGQDFALFERQCTPSQNVSWSAIMESWKTATDKEAVLRSINPKWNVATETGFLVDLGKVALGLDRVERYVTKEESKDGTEKALERGKAYTGNVGRERITGETGV